VPVFDRHPPYRDRRQAGRELAAHLLDLKGLQLKRRGEVVVLALPRGGVPVGSEIARALEAPPGDSELAMGAIASGGVRVLNEDVLSCCSIPDAVIDDVAREEQVELEATPDTVAKVMKP
jgi:putative phosphoribosyl transferase